LTTPSHAARAHDKALRVARTIADLDQSEAIEPAHLNKAINCRMRTGFMDVRHLL